MNLQAIVSHPLVRQARSVLQSRDRNTVDEQIRLASIPAPTGLEGKRADYVHDRFAELGLNDPNVDEVGNVLATLPGRGAAGSGERSPVLLAAHLDTVFPEGTEIVPRTEGDRVFAPGITDNARGLAAILAVAEALLECRIETQHPVLFVATVGEEGLGDLRGVKHLFRRDSPFRRAAAFLSIDGAGVARIVNRAIGACRLRATLSGLGGHSWGDRGLANPAHALGQAITSLSALRPPGDAPYAITVGRVGGGTSINSIPAEAWLELDLRSESTEALDWMETEARDVLERAARLESAGSSRGAPVVAHVEKIGSRPCGAISDESPVVQAAVAATRLLGGVPELAASSTDANVPISLGIPALAMGAGGRAGGVHTMDEWFENHGGYRGIERALLTVLAIAGVQGVDQDG